MKTPQAEIVAETALENEVAVVGDAEALLAAKMVCISDNILGNLSRLRSMRTDRIKNQLTLHRCPSIP